MGERWRVRQAGTGEEKRGLGAAAAVQLWKRVRDRQGRMSYMGDIWCA